MFRNIDQQLTGFLHAVELLELLELLDQQEKRLFIEASGMPARIISEWRMAIKGPTRQRN